MERYTLIKTTVRDMKTIAKYYKNTSKSKGNYNHRMRDRAYAVFFH